MVADSPRSPRRALRLPRGTGSRPGAHSSLGGVAPRTAGSTAPGSASFHHHHHATTSHSRPPVLLELSPTYVRAGFVGQLSAPQIALCHASPPHPQAPASEWYRYYSPILQDATSYVLEGSAVAVAAQHPTPASTALTAAPPSAAASSSSIDRGRRVMIIYHGMPHMGKNQLHALRRLLLVEYNMPALSVQPAMKMAFYAAAAATTTTTTRTASANTEAGAVSTATPLEHGMIVYVHGGEAHCVAVAHSRSLEYTYQATGRIASSGNRRGPATTMQQNWEQCWKQHFLNEESPHSLALCIVRCLEACARDDRHRVVSNFVYCGDWFVSDPSKVQHFVAQQVRKLLTPAEALTKRLPVPKTTDDDAGTESGGEAPSPTSPQRDATSEPFQPSFTHRAISSELRTQRLADSVGAVRSPSDSHSIPCELLPWVGAHVWAKHWHSVHPDAPAFQWETKQT